MPLSEKAKKRLLNIGAAVGIPIGLVTLWDLVAARQGENVSSQNIENPVDTSGQKLHKEDPTYLMQHRSNILAQNQPEYYETTLESVPSPIIGSPKRLTYNGTTYDFLVIRTVTENEGIELAIDSHSPLAQKTYADIIKGKRVNIDARGIYVLATGADDNLQYPVFIADVVASHENIALAMRRKTVEAFRSAVYHHPLTESLAVTAAVAHANPKQTRAEFLQTATALTAYNFGAMIAGRMRRTQRK